MSAKACSAVGSAEGDEGDKQGRLGLSEEGGAGVSRVQEPQAISQFCAAELISTSALDSSANEMQSIPPNRGPLRNHIARG